MMSELLLYYLHDGLTRVGRGGGETVMDIQLSGASILEEHCHFQISENGEVT